jgi:hypothetical protein
MEHPTEPLSGNRTERKTLNERINHLHKVYAIRTTIDVTSDEEHPRKKVRWDSRLVINTPKGIEDTSDEEEDVPKENVIRDEEEEGENKHDSEEEEDETSEPDEETDNLSHAEKVVNYTGKNVYHVVVMSRNDARKAMTARTVFVSSDSRRPPNVCRPRA